MSRIKVSILSKHHVKNLILQNLLTTPFLTPKYIRNASLRVYC